MSVPPLISDADRASLEILLRDRCAITRVTRTQSATTGGWSETESTYVDDIPCRIDKSGLTPRERAIAERYGSVETFKLLLSMKASRWPGGVVSTLASDRVTVTGEAAGSYHLTEDGGPVTTELAREVIVVKIS